MAIVVKDDPYWIAFIKIDKLIEEIRTKPELKAFPEKRQELIDHLLEKRSKLMEERDRGFRIVDRRKLRGLGP